MQSNIGLNTTQILATAEKTLVEAAYRTADTGKNEYWRPAGRRVYEDTYGVVGLVVFDSWIELERGWRKAQAELVKLLSQHLSEGEPKAWDGYLLLLTPGHAPSEQAVAEIRYDLTRLRKIVAGGERLRTVRDVKRVISPLLPLTLGSGVDEPPSPFAQLPKLIADEEIPVESVQALMRAYVDQESMMQALHQSLVERAK